MWHWLIDLDIIQGYKVVFFFESYQIRAVIFQDSWVKDPSFSTWLKRSGSKNNEADYSLCKKTFDYKSVDRPALNSHMKGKKYLSLASASSSNDKCNMLNFITNSKGKLTRGKIKLSEISYYNHLGFFKTTLRKVHVHSFKEIMTFYDWWMALLISLLTRVGIIIPVKWGLEKNLRVLKKISKIWWGPCNSQPKATSSCGKF